MATRGGKVRVTVTLDDKDLTAGTGRATRSLSHMEQSGTRSLQNLGKAAKVAGAAIAAGVVVGAKESAEAAIEAEKAQTRLEAQLKASGTSWAKYGDQIDATLQKQSQMSGLDDEDLADSFTNLLRVTGDVNKSLDLNVIAMDFARAKNMEVAKAGELVGKVAGGNVGILSRYGISVKKGATATEALGMLQQKFSGQAKAYGETTAGAADRASVALENAGEVLGAKLTPMIADLANGMADLITGMQNGTGVGGQLADVAGTVAGKVGDVVDVVGDLIAGFKRGDATAVALVATLAGLAAGFTAFKVVGMVTAGVQGATTAFWALNGAMSANPIGLVVVGLTALGVGLVIAYKKSETFRNVADGAFSVVRKTAGTMFDVITFGIRQFLTGIGKIAGAVSHVPGMGWLKGVSEAALDAAGTLKNVSDAIKGIPDEKRIKIVASTIVIDGQRLTVPSGPANKAEGGPIPGVGNTDSVPAMLMPGEHVWTKSEVAAAGGHDAMFAMRQLFATGRVKRYSSGGIVSRAQRLDSMDKPYRWGGGHGDGGRNGFDCSGAVSWVLGVSPRVSGQFTSFGSPGPGKPNDTKIFANPEHVFMVINGVGYGTSRENPGGGFGRLSYNYRSGFTIRHLNDANGGGSAGGSGGSTGDPQEKDESSGSPSQRRLESGLANADLALARAEGTATPSDDIKALQSKQNVMKARLRTVNVALKSKGLSHSTRVRLVTEQAGLLRDLRSTGASIKDLRPSKPTAGELAELGIATASLTPDLGDDYTAAGALFGVREKELAAARRTGDPQKITEAINNLKAAGDTLKNAADAIKDAWKKPIEERLGQLDAAAVQAKVNTPDYIGDDLAVLNSQLAENTTAYQQAVAAGDADAIVQYGNAIISLRDAINGLTDATAAQTATTEALLTATQARLELERAAKLDAQRAYNVSQAQYGPIMDALAALVGRAQGGRVGLAVQAAGTPGKVASGL